MVLRQRGQVLTSARRRVAVLGSPIEHSLSPVLHRAAYHALGLDWSYQAIEVQEAGLAGFLDGLDDSWAGLSLTMPLKEAVLPLLDSVSDLAEITHCANTVLLCASGRSGDNTDVPGIVAAVRASGGAGAQRVCIIGAGATARSAVAAAAQLGAREVVVVARRLQAGQSVISVAHRLGLTARVRGWDASGDALMADLVIATVPGDAAASLAQAVPDKPGLLLDVTYWPWPTSLADSWLRAGGSAIPGSQMLLWQAARQVELMTGRTAPITDMARALEAALSARTGVGT